MMVMMEAHKSVVKVEPVVKVDVAMLLVDAEAIRSEILALCRYGAAYTHGPGSLGMDVNCPALMRLNSALCNASVEAREPLPRVGRI